MNYNYYNILNVEYDASIDEIKKAYKSIALKLHPDQNDGNKFLSDQFKLVQNAYSVLIDDEKRRKYDESIGIKRSPKLYEEVEIKRLYEEAIARLEKDVNKEVYSYLLEKTDSIYLSKIILDAANEYNRVKKEKEEEEQLQNKVKTKINSKYEICPYCKKPSEKKYNVCENCFKLKH